MENKIYIVGCGGHARSVADVILDNDPATLLIFVDKNARNNETIFGFPVITSLPSDAEKIFIAAGDNNLRRLLSNKNKKLINVVSKRAYISPYANIASSGVFIGNGAHIGPYAKIGQGAIINTNAVVEHEVEIGDFTHISVNATICGRVKIGSNVCIGAASVIRDKVCVGDDVVVGCGAVIVKDISLSGIYVGCPAKKMES